MMKRNVKQIFTMIVLSIFLVGGTTIKAEAENYPTLVFCSDAEFKNTITSTTATIGETVSIRMKWFAAFDNEGYDIAINDEEGFTVSTVRQTFTVNNTITLITVDWDTTDHPKGKYTIEVTKKYYSSDRWNEAPTIDCLYITLSEPEIPATEPKESTAPETEVDIASAPSESAQEKAILTQKNDNDPKNSKFGILQAKAAKTTSNSITLKWKKVKGATKYIIYGSKCGKGIQLKKLKTVKGTSFTQKKLNKGTYYKYMVVAAGSGKAISTSKVIHATTTGGKYGNAVKVTVKKTKVSLKVKKTCKLGATVKNNKITKKHRRLSYESSNANIAKVDKNGKVTALKKGICYIYAYAQNGIMAKVKVTVK